jgi:N-acetylglucosamine kinase-like BadF-type ATPase
VGPVTRPAVLAVDGGGSKTDVLLADATGRLLAHARGQGTNPQMIGIELAMSRIQALVEEAGRQCGLAPGNGPVAGHAGVYLAGVDLPLEVEQVEQRVQAAGWAPTHVVDNDVFALLRAGTSNPDAVAVICGTGINCVGVRRDGATSRFPSLGPISGDWGGGGHLGEKALWWAARSEDGRADPSSLSAAVAGHFGLPTVMAVGEALHFGRLDEHRLAELTPLVFAEAAAGDWAAVKLVNRLALEIAGMATVSLRRLSLLAAKADVVLGGGVLRAGHADLLADIERRIRTEAPDVTLRVVTDAPVVGAVLLALDHVGAGPEAEATARTATTAWLQRTLTPPPEPATVRTAPPGGGGSPAR